MASSQKLSEIADRACFLNHNFFHRHRTMDWLKLYVLFYDFIVLEERYTVNIGSELVFKYSEIWSKLKKSVIYLEDSGSRPDRKELNNWATEQLRPIILTRSGQFNKSFFKSYNRRMKLRSGGSSDFSTEFDFLKEYGGIERGGWESNAIDDFADAYLSIWIRQTTGMPSVLDSVGDWVIRKALSNDVPVNVALNSFENVVVKEIPDFYRLPWDAILQLRESKYRKQCVEYIKKFPFEHTINDLLRDAMWRLVTEIFTESSLRKTSIKGVIGNLPGLAVNPLGLWFAGKDVFNLKQKQDAYGWIYFISEIRKINEDRGESYTLLPRSVRSITKEDS